MKTSPTPKVLVIGLDCAPPQLVFQDMQERLPTLHRLMWEGCHGPMKSCDPPITIPAWACMLSGKSPADLGFFGFKNRKPGAYFENEFVTSESVRVKRVWEILGEHQKRSLLLGVPQTYPAYSIHGEMVSDFLTPSLDSSVCTYPPGLKEELLRICPGYLFDVPDFRNEKKETILDSLHKGLDQHFRFFEHLLSTREWDFAMMVEMGTDRIQHCFWSDLDPAHPLHDPKSPFKNAIPDFYERVDRHLESLLKLVPSDTSIFVVSDHGAKSMTGAIAINEWLLAKGYLKLKKNPEAVQPIEKCDIDWPGTQAWAAGGYYGRIYFNIRGRERHGCVEPADYEKLRQKVADEIKSIKGLDQKPLDNKVVTPETLYGKKTANAPDLFVYFDDLNYRALGSIGTGQIAHLKNDQGPDGANHDYEGILILKGPGISSAREPLRNLSLMDITPTILGCFGITPPEALPGKDLLKAPDEKSETSGFSKAEEALLEERLRSLGYLG